MFKVFGLPDAIAAVGFVGICYLAVKFSQWLRSDIPESRKP
jgi:hypothetical protein